MSGPISPNDVVAAKTTAIPEAAFEAINATIARHWDGRTAKFTLTEVSRAIADKMGTTVRELDIAILDFEECYRARGWSVEFDRPGYNESYAATFTFARSK